MKPNLKPMRVVPLPCLLFGLVSCAHQSQIASSTLPLLRVSPIAPKKNTQKFSQRSGYYYYDSAMSKVKPLVEMSPEEAAMNWVVEHFGPLEEGVQLSVKTVERKKGFETEVRVDLGVTYLEVITDRLLLVTVRDGIVKDAIVDFCEFEIIPDSSKPIISAEQALEVWQSRYEKMTESWAKDRLEMLKTITPRLEYAWSAKRSDGGTKDILAPTWVLEPPMMVDAQDGYPIWDD